MNTPNRPHEELDADERELARVVRALPGNEPPPALDLRILRAAQDAVALPGKRKRRALWAANSAGSFWGFGTAAAAVLAVGISWQMFMRAPSGNLPTSSPAAVAKDGVADDEATSVDFVSIAPPSDQAGATGALASAPASKPMLERQRANSGGEPKRAERESAGPPLPEPFADEHVAEADTAETRAQAQLGDVDQFSRDRRADMAAAKSAVAENAPAESAATTAAPAIVMAPAPMQKPAAPPPPASDVSARELSSMAKTESANAVAADAGMLAGAAAPAAEAQAKQADEESPESARHRVRLDARLYPESWIAKIRSRLRHGDVAGARASLKLFVEHYPRETVPTNLQPLLGE
jgi:hypothetical protein